MIEDCMEMIGGPIGRCLWNTELAKIDQGYMLKCGMLDG